MNVEEVLDREEELDSINSKRIILADDLQILRTKYGEAKFKLFIELAKKIKEYQSKRKALGVDMAIIMMMAEDQEKEKPELENSYKDYITCYEEYKGLVILVEALRNKSISIQAIMKHSVDNERFGNTN